MGTRSDYYIGKGKKIEWLGSTAWDGYPDGGGLTKSHPAVMQATDERAFRTAVGEMLAKREDATLPEHGWPWPWDDSRTTDFAYTFDEGKAWLSNFGRKWVPVAEYLAWDEVRRDEYSDEGKEVVFPNMKAQKRVTFGRRSGVMVLGLTPEGPKVIEDKDERGESGLPGQ